MKRLKKKQIAKEWKIIQQKNRKTFQKSQNLINHVFNIFTLLPFAAKPADQWKNIYRIDAHMKEESTQEIL